MKRFGWLPDIPDKRDHVYSAPRVKKLPAKVSLRSQCPPVVDQGALGSCVANAVGSAYRFDQMKQGLADFMPSRLFIYYSARVRLGTVNSDSGAIIRDGIKSIAKEGAPRERLWPYKIEKFTTKPPAAVYKTGLRYQALSYQRVMQTLPEMKGCIAAGFPFVFGFAVYESIDSDVTEKTGRISLPTEGEASYGGHCMLACAYDDAAQMFSGPNSWGKSWGDDGWFSIPYAYLTDPDLADDFWTVRLVER